MPRLRPRAILTSNDLPKQSAFSTDADAGDEPNAPVAQKSGGVGNYFGRLVTYIPAEVIAVYQAFAGPIAGSRSGGAEGSGAAAGNVAAAPDLSTLQNSVGTTAGHATAASSDAVLIGLGLLLAVLTPVWIYVMTKDKNEPAATHQIVIGTLAFLIWLLATSNPIVQYVPDWQPIYGSLAMAVAAGLLFPLIERFFQNKAVTL